MDKVKESGASAREMLEHSEGVLAARASSLLEVTKSAFAEVMKPETEACTSYHQLVTEVEGNMCKRPRQDLDEAQADNELQLKSNNGSLLISSASYFMLMVNFSLPRRRHSPSSTVQETYDLRGISRSSHEGESYHITFYLDLSLEDIAVGATVPLLRCILDVLRR